MSMQEDQALLDEYGIDVIAPSGALYKVLNEEERFYFEDIARRYMEDNHFTNITDLQDVDRIVHMETLSWRWSNWLTREVDYFGDKVDLEKTQKSIETFSKEIRLNKKQLGIDKGSREKDKGQSISDYIDNLRVRAKEFGVMRNNQAIKAITLFKELESLLTLHDNCTPEERRDARDLRIETEDIFKWLRETAIPEMNEIDKVFRDHQKIWIRSM